MIEAIIKFINDLFSKPLGAPSMPQPPPVPLRPNIPDPEIIINFDKWCEDAALISSTFEGKGGDYANVVGNFDGAYLTCGLLGLTWKYGNQVKIIDKFLIKHGQKKLLSYMPETGQEYLRAVNAGEVEGANIVAKWTNVRGRVSEPYKSELEAFWASPEMITLQNETYQSMMGVFAKKKCLEAQEFFKLKSPLFEHYVFYFDQAVLNGASKTIPFAEAKSIEASSVIEFAQNCSGYNVSSMRKNAKIWAQQLNKATYEQIYMFKLAYLRALKSRKEFQGTTLMRRGTLALGVGYVNEELRKYDWG